MTKNLLAPVGVLLILVGGLWTLQGLDVVGGSGMSGKTLWAVIGPIVALAGLGLVVLAFRGRKTP
jgi:energy-coupling factor transporter transmembrane protein EcfT